MPACRILRGPPPKKKTHTQKKKERGWLTHVENPACPGWYSLRLLSNAKRRWEDLRLATHERGTNHMQSAYPIACICQIATSLKSFFWAKRPRRPKSSTSTTWCRRFSIAWAKCRKKSSQVHSCQGSHSNTNIGRLFHFAEASRSWEQAPSA